MGDNEVSEYYSTVSHLRERRQFIANQVEYRRRERKEAMFEAKLIAGYLARYLSNLGFDHIFSRENHKTRQIVRVERIQITPDEFRFKIDGHRLPYGIDLYSMADPKVVKSLEASIGCPMEVRLDYGGLWYRVYRKSGIYGIPAYVKYSDCLAGLKPSDGPLTVPIGIGSKRHVIKINLQNDTTSHFLIAGTTGSGKTTLVHSIITTLAKRNPKQVRIMLLDLKRFEFLRYAGLPHLLQSIVRDMMDVLPAVQSVRQEVDRRLKLFEQMRHVSKLYEYNMRKSDHDRLPYWVLIFDEIASIMLEPTLPQKYKDDVESNLGYIARLGRAVGVHAIIATQRIHRDVITPLIASNFNGHIGLACSSSSDSILIVGNGDAYFTTAVPVGRAVLSYGRFNVPFQCAYVSPGEIDDVITNAEAGLPLEETRTWDVTIQEMVEYALETRGEPPTTYGPGEVGSLSVGFLHDHFRLRGPDQEWIRWELKRYTDGMTFRLNGQDYTLSRNGDGAMIKIVNLSLRHDLECQKTPQQWLEEFIQTRCELDPNLWVRAAELRTACEAWLHENGQEPVSDREWGAALRQVGCEREMETLDRKAVRVWSGIRLLPLTTCQISDPSEIVYAMPEAQISNEVSGEDESEVTYATV